MAPRYARHPENGIDPHRFRHRERQAWLEKTWQGLAVTPETQTMYGYLEGALGKHDRLYLLGETVDNLLSS